jgi:GcrA cell cycle regulator
MPCSSDDFDWNSDTIAELRLLWAEGLSTAEIGRRIGVSKNVVIGKSHRLELQARPSPIRRDGVRKPPVAPRPRCPSLAELQNWTVTANTPLPVRAVSAEVRPNPLQAVPPVRIVREMIPVAIAVLRTQSCCWPIGEPGTRSFRFCDAPNEAGKSYCLEHCRLAYRKKEPRPKAA